MAQKNSADVPFKIGEVEYTLRFSLKAQLALKDQWGLEKDDDVQKRMQSLETGDVVDVLWAALRSHHPDVDRDAVIDLLDDAEQEDFEVAMASVISGAMPPRSEGASEKKPKSRPKN